MCKLITTFFQDLQIKSLYKICNSLRTFWERYLYIKREKKFEFSIEIKKTSLIIVTLKDKIYGSTERAQKTMTHKVKQCISYLLNLSR